MKVLNFFAIMMAFALAACSTSSNVYDDVYYSRKAKSNQVDRIASAPQIQEQKSIQSTNSEYEYQSYYQNDVAGQVESSPSEPVYTTSETVVEPDGTTYTTTETYYDSEYAQRLRRFNSGASSSFGYYDGFNTGCYDCYGSSFSMNFGYPYGMGYSMGFGYGYPYYGSYWGYYDPFFSDPWYYSSFYSWRNPWRYGYWGGGYGGYWNGYRNGYMHGYWDGYYGGSWDYPNSSWKSNYFYGHRGSYAGGTTVSSGSPRGNRTDQNQGTSYGGDRGVRNSDAAAVNKTSAVSDRGSVGQRPVRDNNQSVANRAERGTSTQRPQSTQQGVNRAERPASAAQNQSKPSAQQKVNEYRQRYDRPVSNNQNQVQTRTQQYERPRTYTAPSTRQPKSSNEYVRPQAEPGRNTGTVNRSTNTRPTPTQRSTNTGENTNSGSELWHNNYAKQQLHSAFKE